MPLSQKIDTVSAYGHCAYTSGKCSIAEPNTAQMLDHMVQYVDSSPDASPAILTAIGHMQMQEGIWYPMGGTRAVPEALVKLATELGVIFHASTDVKQILITNNKHQAVTGLVTTDGTTYEFDAIVSNEDAVRTHRELLAKTTAAKKFEDKHTYEPACSGVVLYLGLKKRYKHLAHHDFVFSRDPEEEFHHIYDLGEPAPDPTCYLACTATSDPASAPEGCEAMYVLVYGRIFRRHFRSVMVQQAEQLAEAQGPLIVFANHSSWWDPMVSISRSAERCTRHGGLLRRGATLACVDHETADSDGPHRSHGVAGLAGQAVNQRIVGE